MALSISSAVADLEKIIAEAKLAVPTLQAFVAVAEKIKPLLPAADQVFVTDGEAAVTALVDILSKV